MQKILISLLCVLLFSCDGNKVVSYPKVLHLKGNTMGTYYSIKIDEVKVDAEKIQLEIEVILTKLNKIFSTYLLDSELSLLNTQSFELKTKVSPEMNEVLLLSKRIFMESDGAFDPTVGPIVNRFGFGPEKDKTQPTSAEIKELLINVGVKHFSIEDGYFSKKTPKLYIDLSAIAKGYAVDKVLEFLVKDKGFRNVLVEIGGEVRGQGFKDQSVWAIGIEKPSETLGGAIQKVVPLLNKSIATSGSYRNFLRFGDKIFSHTINPKTGMPVEHKLVSVSVLDRQCVVADAWATALMVLGPEKGLEIANEKGLLAYFLVKTDNGFDEISSKAFDLYMNAFNDKDSK